MLFIDVRNISLLQVLYVDVRNISLLVLYVKDMIFTSGTIREILIGHTLVKI